MLASAPAALALGKDWLATTVLDEVAVAVVLATAEAYHAAKAGGHFIRPPTLAFPCHCGVIVIVDEAYPEHWLELELRYGNVLSTVQS